MGVRSIDEITSLAVPVPTNQLVREGSVAFQARVYESVYLPHSWDVFSENERDDRHTFFLEAHMNFRITYERVSPEETALQIDCLGGRSISPEERLPLSLRVVRCVFLITVCVFGIGGLLVALLKLDRMQLL